MSKVAFVAIAVLLGLALKPGKTGLKGLYGLFSCNRCSAGFGIETGCGIRSHIVPP
jgi:hypothetical protein